MTSEATEELIRAHWYASIPVQFRNDGKERRGSNQHDRHLSSAIILGPPPRPLLDRWFMSIRMHLTKDQLKARAARENCGKPGRRKGEPWTARDRNRARPKPSLAPVPAEVLRPLSEPTECSNI